MKYNHLILSVFSFASFCFGMQHKLEVNVQQSSPKQSQSLFSSPAFTTALAYYTNYTNVVY